MHTQKKLIGGAYVKLSPGLFPMLFGSVWSLTYRNRPGTRTNLYSRKKGGGRKPLD